jgi:hypothetical protein
MWTSSSLMPKLKTRLAAIATFAAVAVEQEFDGLRACRLRFGDSMTAKPRKPPLVNLTWAAVFVLESG